MITKLVSKNNHLRPINFNKRSPCYICHSWMPTYCMDEFSKHSPMQYDKDENMTTFHYNSPLDMNVLVAWHPWQCSILKQRKGKKKNHNSHVCHLAWVMVLLNPQVGLKSCSIIINRYHTWGGGCNWKHHMVTFLQVATNLLPNLLSILIAYLG